MIGFPNQDIEYGQPSSLTRRETKDWIHVSAAVSSVSRWEVKAYLIDVWDIPERAVPQGPKGCYACPNQAKNALRAIL